MPLDSMAVADWRVAMIFDRRGPTAAGDARRARFACPAPATTGSLLPSVRLSNRPHSRGDVVSPRRQREVNDMGRCARATMRLCTICWADAPGYLFDAERRTLCFPVDNKRLNGRPATSIRLPRKNRYRLIIASVRSARS